MNGNDKQNLTVTPDFLAGRGYSLSKAARAVDVSVTHLIKVCTGKRKASEALLERIFEAVAHSEKSRKSLNLRDFQRTGRDSNPRYAFDVHTISNRALSTTQTPAQSNCFCIHSVSAQR